MEDFLQKVIDAKHGIISVMAQQCLDNNTPEEFIDYLGQQACIDARISTQRLLGEDLYNEIVELYGNLPEELKTYTTGKQIRKL